MISRHAFERGYNGLGQIIGEALRHDQRSGRRETAQLHTHQRGATFVRSGVFALRNADLIPSVLAGTLVMMPGLRFYFIRDDSELLRAVLVAVAHAMPELTREASNIGPLRRPKNDRGNEALRDELERRIATAFVAGMRAAGVMQD